MLIVHSERGQRPVTLESPDLPTLSLTCTMQRRRKKKKKTIRLGKGDEKGKETETEVTCFCSWLSDAEADGSGQNCSAREILYWPRLESGEREGKRKEVDIRCHYLRPVTQGHLFQHRQRSKNLGRLTRLCSKQRLTRESARFSKSQSEIQHILREPLRETQPALRKPQSEGKNKPYF